MDQDSSWGWVMGAIGSVGAVLSGAVANLYRNQVKIYETRITQLEGTVSTLGEASAKCQQEHTVTKIELATLHERLRALEDK